MYYHHSMKYPYQNKFRESMVKEFKYHTNRNNYGVEINIREIIRKTASQWLRSSNIIPLEITMAQSSISERLSARKIGLGIDFRSYVPMTPKQNCVGISITASYAIIHSLLLPSINKIPVISALASKIVKSILRLKGDSSNRKLMQRNFGSIRKIVRRSCNTSSKKQASL